MQPLLPDEAGLDVAVLGALLVLAFAGAAGTSVEACVGVGDVLGLDDDAGTVVGATTVAVDDDGAGTDEVWE